MVLHVISYWLVFTVELYCTVRVYHSLSIHLLMDIWIISSLGNYDMEGF